uniref:Uncharacterized protein n=1 Tax=Rhizophora mucronata TaxID=61149 RepID=A0A2P2IK24_RHIMU
MSARHSETFLLNIFELLCFISLLNILQKIKLNVYFDIFKADYLFLFILCCRAA